MSAPSPMVVTQYIGPKDKEGIMIGQVLEPCPAEVECEECAAGKVKILGRNYYGVLGVRHVDPKNYSFRALDD